MELTASQRTIMNLKDKAMQLEAQRRKAYADRLSEIVAETSQWKEIPPEAMPMKIAERAFALGRDFGAGKMFEYI